MGQPRPLEQGVECRGADLGRDARRAMALGELEAGRGHQLVLLGHVEPRRGIGHVGDEPREILRARPVSPVVGRKRLERIDGHSRPAELGFEVVRVALVPVVIGPDVEEDAVAPILEEVPNEPLLGIARMAVRPVGAGDRCQLVPAVRPEPSDDAQLGRRVRARPDERRAHQRDGDETDERRVSAVGHHATSAIPMPPGAPPAGLRPRPAIASRYTSYEPGSAARRSPASRWRTADGDKSVRGPSVLSGAGCGDGLPRSVGYNKRIT